MKKTPIPFLIVALYLSLTGCVSSSTNETSFTKEFGSYTIREEAADATTIQYYIVGDHKFVLVHETAFGDTQETDAAAKTILDSFLWAE